jgi:hypothetical protein
MMQALKSFFLIILIEAIYAVISYLTQHLARHMHRRGQNQENDFEPEYA